MSCNELLDEANIVKYIRPGLIEHNGDLEGRAFKPRDSDTHGLSVDWLGAFDLPKSNQLAEVRRRSRICMKPRGLIAEVNVGDIRTKTANVRSCTLEFVHDPQAANERYVCNPAHSLIKGIPKTEPDEVHPVCDLIADCVVGKHSTQNKSELPD